MLTTLYTIHERSNPMRHFGTKLGNCWFYTLFEIVYLHENRIISDHPILHQKSVQKNIQSKNFVSFYDKYVFLKNKCLNVLDNLAFPHTKDFNRDKLESTTKVKFIESLDAPVILSDHIAILSAQKQCFGLKIRKTQINKSILEKMKKK